MALTTLAFTLSSASRCCHCPSWVRRDCSSTTRSPFSPSVWCVRARGSSDERYVSPGLLSGRQMREKLWRELFSDPSHWWDHRPEKVNPRYPDFKHKSTRQSLWLSDNLTPAWVTSELAAMAPDLLETHVFSWHVRLRRHVKAGDYKMALNLFQQMQRQGVMLDKFTFVPVLNACSNLRSLEEGRRVHEHIIARGCDSDTYVVNCLVEMYAKCGSIEDAWSVFNTIRERNVVSWNAMIGGYVNSGQGVKAIELFERMKQEGVKPDTVTFIRVLNACASVAAIEEGRRVHDQIIQVGCESDVYVANGLIDMYAKCGSIEDAWRVFNNMRDRNVVSWNVIIGSYVKSEQGLKAMELFAKMQQEGMKPNAVTFVGALSACASVMAIKEGRRVHEQIIDRGGESDVYVATCLVDMYAKCGSIEDARGVFDKMRERDVVAWNAMIGGYVKSQQGLIAIGLFRDMQEEGVNPDAVTFIGALNACASIAALEEGRHIHDQVIQRGCEYDIYVANSLIGMYAKCGSVEDAWSVFSKMRERNVVSWSAMITGYVKSEQGLKAIELFKKMQQEGVEPNSVTLIGVLNACASVAVLEEGRRIHELIIKRGWESDVCVANCLVDMYAKCGSIEDAWSVFNKMQGRDVVSWNAIIGGYVKSEQGLKAMDHFREMQQEGLEPDAVTFVGVLNACASLVDLEEGRRVHEQIIQRGFQSDVYVANCLIDTYAKCGSIEDAWSVFNHMLVRNVVSWSAMIGGYVKCGQGLKAMELFREMQQEGVEPNAVTFIGMLNACASVAALEEGRRVHEQIIQSGCESDVYVANCLVDMYANSGSIEDALSVFNNIQERNIISWRAMIGGYVRSRQGLKAIELFREMEQEGAEPDSVTFAGVLSACASVVALAEGRRVHGQIIQKRYESDVYVANCLVDMYAKCGSIEDAWSVFNKMRERNIFSWTAIIGGYAMHGHAQEAIELFKQMGREGVELDGITFISLLSACSHGGLVKEGQRYFKSMTSCYAISPNMEHYTCMVDLLGRAGRLDEAEELTKKIPKERNISVWMSLLGACRIYGNVEIAEWAAKRCWELNPEDASGQLLLSNIYAAAGKWDQSAAIGKERLDKCGMSQAATWTEVKM